MGVNLSSLDNALDRELCKRNPEYFVTHFVNIYDSTARAWIPFHLWEAQGQALTTLTNNKLTVWLKSRQVGATWLSEAYGLWNALFNPIAEVLLFSLREKEALYLLERMKGMYNHLPKHLQVPLVKESASLLEFKNGSVIRAFPTGRGDSYTATLAIVDEADLVPDLEVMLGSIKPTIDAGGKLILLSRANKRKPQTAFKKIYTQAQQGLNDYQPIFTPWHAHPNRTEAWYDSMVRNAIDLDEVYEQYPATPEQALAMGYAGLVYSNFSLGNVSALAEYDPNYPILWGVDIGYEHPTVILMAQERPFNGYPDYLCVFDMVCLNRMLLSDILQWTAEHKPYPTPERIFYDTAAPSFVAEYMRAFPLSYSSLEGANKDVIEGIRNVRRLFGSATLPRLLQIHPRCDTLIKELGLYHWDTVDVKPVKVNDDSVDALRYLAAYRMYSMWEG